MTDLKLSLSKLEKNERRLHQAQQMTRTGHWDWFRDGNRLVWSDEVYNIFGRNPAQFELTLESFERTIHPDDYNHFVKDRKNALSKGCEVNTEHRILLPDGDIRHVHELAYIIRDERGRVIQVSGTIQDVTEAKEIKKALEENEQRYQQLFENMNSGVAIYRVIEGGKDFSFLNINSAGEKFSRIKKRYYRQSFY